MILALTGWVTILGLTYSTALYWINMVSPRQDNNRVTVHCTVGKISFASMLLHIIKSPSLNFDQIAIWSAIGLVFITVGTGVVLSYLPEAGKLRFHARSIHPALMVGIAVAAIHHILVILDII